MFDAISVCVIGGQLVLLTFGGIPLEGESISASAQQSEPLLVSTNRVCGKRNFHKEESKWLRRRKNAFAKANHNKWKSMKRRQK
jgi:hypothetical protein